MLKTHPCRCAENPALPMFSARPSPISMRASSQIACPLKWACVARCAENPPLPMFSARPFLRTCLLYHARESTANLVVCFRGISTMSFQLVGHFSTAGNSQESLGGDTPEQYAPKPYSNTLSIKPPLYGCRNIKLVIHRTGPAILGVGRFWGSRSCA